MNEAEAERGLVSLLVGYHMRQCRMQRNLSQSEVAQGIGSQSMISLLESGRQFPPADVLTLVAERLQDETLLCYANRLSAGHWSVMDFTSTNHVLLVEVLRSHRGRWHAVHLRVALELCEHFYYQRLFEIVSELCQLILERSTDAVSQEKACYYRGSACLFNHEYEQAEMWLRRADNGSDLLDDATRGRLYYNLGYTYCELDVYGVAVWYAKLAVDTFHRINDYQRYGRSLGLLGAIQARQGRFEEAHSLLKQAMELLQHWGISDVDRARLAVSLADVSLSLSDFTGAEAWCISAIQAGTEASDFKSVSAAYQMFCLVYKGRGEVSLAVDAVRAAVSAAERAQDHPTLFHAYLLASGVLTDRGECQQAAEYAYLSAQQSNNLGQQALAVDCLAHLSDPTQPELAAAYRDQALRLYREYGSKQVVSPSSIAYLPFRRPYDS